MNKNEKTILQDTTFLIPVRLDSIVRLENVISVVNYLHKHFQSRIHVLEASGYNNGLIQTYLADRIHYRFIQDFDPIFYRTKYINEMVRNCDTPYLGIWDADVIVPPRQIITALHSLRNKEAHFVIPYRHNFFETSEIIREKFIQSGDLSILEKNAGKMVTLYSPSPVGGAFFANRNTYVQIGIENENFYGWGRQDGERVVRAKVFGYEFIHIEGALFHLTHDRGINSKFHSTRQSDVKMSEVFRIYSMTSEELQEEVKHWHQNE
jgi:predicted glycosyltransferase involved in capsule biosynthesis